MSDVLNDELQMMAVNAIANAADMAGAAIQQAVVQYGTPSAIFRPKIYIDGNMWCALYGDNIQDGVAGFGFSPSAAMFDFDVNWHKKLGGEEAKDE